MWHCRPRLCHISIPMEIFQGLTREQILAVAGSASYLRVKAGEPIFREGAPAYGLFIVLEGQVEAFHKTADGIRSLAILGPHEVFGEMGMILDSGRHTSSVRAVEDSLVLGIPADHLQILDRVGDPSVAIQLMENLICILGKRLRKLNDAADTRPQSDVPTIDAESEGRRHALAVLRDALTKRGLFSKVSRRVILKAGEYLCREGDVPDGFYFIHSGILEVRQERPPRPPRLLARLSAPNVAGELGFFSAERRSASLRAAYEVRYTLFSGDDFRKLRSHDPAEAVAVLLAAAQLIVHLILEAQAGPANET